MIPNNFNLISRDMLKSHCQLDPKPKFTRVFPDCQRLYPTPSSNATNQIHSHVICKLLMLQKTKDFFNTPLLCTAIRCQIS